MTVEDKREVHPFGMGYRWESVPQQLKAWKRQVPWILWHNQYAVSRFLVQFCWCTPCAGPWRQKYEAYTIRYRWRSILVNLSVLAPCLVRLHRCMQTLHWNSTPISSNVIIFTWHRSRRSWKMPLLYEQKRPEHRSKARRAQKGDRLCYSSMEVEGQSHKMVFITYTECFMIINKGELSLCCSLVLDTCFCD